jgi:hypothetical protein
VLLPSCFREIHRLQLRVDTLVADDYLTEHRSNIFGATVTVPVRLANSSALLRPITIRYYINHDECLRVMRTTDTECPA